MQTIAIRKPNAIRLGAEELIELGQAPQAAVASTPRIATLTREEGLLLVKVLEDIIAFAQSYPLEFNSYCPVDRWQTTLNQVGTWIKDVERQTKSGSGSVSVPTEAVLRLVDLEKCVSAARDARLSAGKIALAFSVSGVAADVIFGWRWVSLGLYLTGLAVLFGQPLRAKLTAEPMEPFKPALGCGDGAAPVKKVLVERVILDRKGLQKHHWGTALPSNSTSQKATCLSRDRYRVRVEGWKDDVVVPQGDWKKVPLESCRGEIEIAVWEPCGTEPRTTPFGPIPKKSGMSETYWVEYTGPLTGGVCRAAGPFG